jgi:hypothetical protein
LPRHQENRLYIHRHYPIPIFLAEFDHRRAAYDSGIVEEHVNAAELSQGSFHDAVAISRLGGICVLEESVGPASDDLLGDVFSALVDVGDGNCGAFAAEQDGRCLMRRR